MNSKIFNKRLKKLSGFTLVELIVVITILAILGTIGFISVQGYSSSARDSTRISNVVNLQKGLTLYQTVSWTYPMPENSIVLTASGTIVGYQGFAKDQVTNIAKLSNGITKDPLNPNMYTTYATNATQTKMQIMVFLEDGSKITSYFPSTFANAGTNYSDRIPLTKWDTLGILVGTGVNLNQPVQELLTATFTGVDIASTSTGYTAIFSKTESISGTGSALFTTITLKRPDEKSLSKYDSSLKAYWDMETLTSNGKLSDLSGNGNDGICQNGSESGACGSVWPKIVNGLRSKGMYFNGNGDFVGIGDTLNMWTGSFTIDILFSWENNSYSKLINKWQTSVGTPANSWYSIRYLPSMYCTSWKDCLYFQVYSNSWTLTALQSGLNKENILGTYHKVTSVINREQNKWYLVFDGVIMDTFSLSALESLDTNIPLAIGALYRWIYGGTNEYYQWIIDEVRIYNRALSDSEIAMSNSAVK